MKYTKRTLAVLLAALLIFGLLVPGAFATETETIAPLAVLPAPAPIATIFPDPALAAAMAEVLEWVLSTPVTVATPVDQADLDKIVTLGHGDLTGRGIQDLEGMQFLSNLGVLSIAGNQVTDLSPLTGLTSLWSLYLYVNPITDLSPLAGLTNLISIWGWDMPISDLTPLAGLTNLEILWLRDNKISDVTPLAGLMNLTSLDLSTNRISDLSPLAGLVNLANLVTFNVSGQQITLPPISLADPLVVANDVFLLNGSHVTPISISNSGTYATPDVTWTGLPGTVMEVSYQFNETFPIAWGTGQFSGTVIQPLIFTPVDVTGVSIPGGNFQINTNATRQLTATIVPTYAANQAVTWASDNTAVATVTANGLVQGVSAGTAMITVTTVCGNFTASVTVTVVAAPPWQPPNNGGGGGGSTPPPQPDPEPEYRFLDVNSGHWFYDAAMFVYKQGIMQGVNATAFSPDATLSRGMVATILHRLEGEPVSTASHGFSDVAPGTWYANAVAWAFENGIVQGVSATSFAPHAPITREQFATMLHRYAEFAGVDISVSAGASLDHFVDAYRTSDWAEDAKLWANYNDLITGRTSTTIVPGGTASRAEAATILMRFIQTF